MPPRAAAITSESHIVETLGNKLGLKPDFPSAGNGRTFIQLPIVRQHMPPAFTLIPEAKRRQTCVCVHMCVSV